MDKNNIIAAMPLQNQEVRIFNRQDAKEAIIQTGKLPEYEIDVNFFDCNQYAATHYPIFLPSTNCKSLTTINKQLNLLTEWMARNALMDLKEFEKQNRVKGNYFEFIEVSDPNAMLIRSILLGVTDAYSYLNSIPQVNDIVLTCESNDSYEEDLYGLYSTQEHTISIYIPPTIKHFAMNEGLNPFLDTTIHEWLHHWFNIFFTDKGLLNLSFLVDADHSQQFIALEEFVGIPKTENYGKHSRSIRAHNSYIAEVLKEVRQKTTQRNYLELDLPNQMISEGCPNF